MVGHSHFSRVRDVMGSAMVECGCKCPQRMGAVLFSPQLVWSINESVCILNHDVCINAHSIVPTVYSLNVTSNPMRILEKGKPVVELIWG